MAVLNQLKNRLRHIGGRRGYGEYKLESYSPETNDEDDINLQELTAAIANLGSSGFLTPDIRIENNLRARFKFEDKEEQKEPIKPEEPPTEPIIPRTSS